MILPNWLYYILKEDGRSAKVINGVVTYTNTKTPLPQTPDGWQNISLGFERPLDKHGLVTSFTLPLGYVRDGSLIVRDALYKETIESKLFLLIQQLELDIDDTDFKWVYRFFYKGELDLSQTEDNLDMVSVPVMEGGIAKLIKANYDTVYSFAMNDPVCVNLKMDGIILNKKGNFALIDGVEIDNTNYSNSSFAPFSFISSEGSASGVSFFTQQLENTSGVAFDDRLQSSNFFAKASDNNSNSVDIHITGSIVYHCTEQDAANGVFMRFLRSGQNVGNQNDYLLFTDTPLVQDEMYSHDIDITIPLAPGERCYLEMFLGGTGVDTKFEFNNTSLLSVEFEFRQDATNIKAYKRLDLFKKIIGKITGSEDYATSQLCEDNNSLVITCGDAIRGIETATLKTSLSDFFKDCDARLFAGMAVRSDSIEIEDRTSYYTEQDEVDLGICLDLKITPATDLICNTYKFGSEKQDIEDVNGKYDPNGNNQFTGPITRVIKEYNQVSPYKAGPYEIELLRINTEGKTTTDDNRDNDTYVIDAVDQQPLTVEVSFFDTFQGITIENADRFVIGQKISITGSASNDGVYDVIGISPFLNIFTVSFAQVTVAEAAVTVTIEWLGGDVYLLNRPAYTIEGIPTDTVFNLSQTPKNLLLKHKSWIAGINAGLGSKKIVFTSGKDNKNTELKTTLAGIVVDEDKDESISSLGDPLILPWYFIFKANPLTFTPEFLEENSNRSYKFTDEYGNEWRGFLRIAGIAPNDFTPQEFKLLASPSNDIKLLIHG